jgi:hypothetical protein
VLAGLALLLVVNSLSSKKAERARKEFALAQGWVYTAGYDDPEGVVAKIKAKLEKVSPENEFDVTSVMTAGRGKERLFLFNCWYRYREGGRKTSLGSACLIESDRFRGVASQVDIIQGSGVGGALLSMQVDMGSSEFARNFIVRTKEPAVALMAVTESMHCDRARHCPRTGLPSRTWPAGSNRQRNDRTGWRGRDVIRCSQCGRVFDRQGEDRSVASISGGIMGDECTESYFYCNQCGIYTVEVYHGRFLREDDVSARGPVSKPEGDERVKLIRERCRPWDKKCRCKAHQSYFGGWLD